MVGVLAATGFTFQVTPTPGQAPGGAGVQSAIDVIAAYALYASAAGFLLGAAIWAIGGRVGNDYTATGGKVGMFTSVAVAFAIGAAPKLLQWAFGLG
jgi:hypothetical protein